MEINEEELVGNRLLQEIELEQSEIDDIIIGKTISERVRSDYSPGEENKKNIYIKSEESLFYYDEMINEVARLEHDSGFKVTERDIENGVEVYDDIMEALLELLNAIGDMNRRLRNGENPMIVYRDVLYAYDFKKCMDTYDYYDSVRQEYR